MQSAIIIIPERHFILKENNSPEGYVFGRDGSRFNYIGPVCATDHRIRPGILYQKLLNHLITRLLLLMFRKIKRI